MKNKVIGAITAAVLGMAFFLPASAQELQGLAGIDFYDANNKFIGRLDEDMIYLSFGSRTVRVDAPGTAGFMHQSAQFLYASSDCTGTRYLIPSDYEMFASLVQYGYVVSPGILWVEDRPSAATNVTLRSAGSAASCQIFPPQQDRVVRAIRIGDLRVLFATPFRIQPVLP